MSQSSSPSNEQNAAIKKIEAWFDDAKGPQVFYLAGAAGTGKSFTANAVIRHLENRKGKKKRKLKRMAAGAFTGKAANVLRRKGVEGATTIHQMIYVPVVDEKTGEVHFTRRNDGPAADADLILLDEISMLSTELADDVLSFGKKVLVLGDPYQLPPVNGLGAFTQSAPDFLLTEIHRQAQESPIIRLATLIRNGELPRRFGSVGSVHVLPLNPETQALAMRRETQLLCGTHRTRYDYTRRIRDLRGHSGLLPAKGEPILCCKNDHATGLFNGMLGTLRGKPQSGVYKGFEVVNLTVEMEDHPGILHQDLPASDWLFRKHIDQDAERPIIKAGMHEFDFGYVLTTHKFQGSEAASVTVIDDSRAFRDDRWKWLYTAVTRSSDELVLLLRQDIGGNWKMPDFGEYAKVA